MLQLWRYRPKHNRTPKIHPIIGGLVWDQVYDNPACANDPDFVPVDEPQADSTSDSGPEQPADQPAEHTSADAGKPGRSK